MEQSIATQEGMALTDAIAGQGILIHVVCNCASYHEGAPSGTRGCGAEGGVRLGEGKLEAAILTAEEWAADSWATQVLRERLPRARAAAEKWGVTASALTALFGAGVVVSSDAAVRSLVVPWSQVYGILGAAALAFAAGSIGQAASAANYHPVDIQSDAAARRTLYEALTKETLRKLRLSRILAMVAGLFLVALVVMRWYAPMSP